MNPPPSPLEGPAPTGPESPLQKGGPVLFQGDLVVEASPQEVWRHLTDVGRWPTWHAGISRMAVDGALEPGRRFHWRMDGMHLHGAVLEAESQRWIRLEIRGMGMAGIQLWSLDPVPGGTRVRLEEALGGWVPFLLRGTVRKTIHLSRSAWLEALRQKAMGTATPGVGGARPRREAQ